ncbi:MAG: hypothetical protein F4230_08450 [Holophagales bacterium]|nr:hypothetical protein [Holophagales bacterium]
MLEEPRGDLAEEVELVVRPEQEGLVEHGGDQGVGHLVPGDVGHQDAGPLLALAQAGDDLRAARLLRLAQPAVQVVALLEVEVDQVVSADRPQQRHRDPVHLHAAQVREVAGGRLRRQTDLLEIGQLGANLGLPGVGRRLRHGEFDCIAQKKGAAGCEACRPGEGWQRRRAGYALFITQVLWTDGLSSKPPSLPGRVSGQGAGC